MLSIEELNKTQLILLTLLISFITSIATGIITTSLLAEVPTTVTQTINRVVERTIETVTPATSNTPSVKEVTVVREEEAIIASIDKSTSSIVRIKENGPDGNPIFRSLGVIVSKDGKVLTDLKGSTSGSYSVTLSDGATLPLSLEKTLDSESLVVFKITPDNTHKNFVPISFAPNAPKLGQSAISISGKEKNSVAIGRILSLGDEIDTDISANGGLSGSPLLNLSGELIGMKVSDEKGALEAGKYVIPNFDSI